MLNPSLPLGTSNLRPISKMPALPPKCHPQPRVKEDNATTSTPIWPRRPSHFFPCTSVLEYSLVQPFSAIAHIVRMYICEQSFSSSPHPTTFRCLRQPQGRESGAIQCSYLQCIYSTTCSVRLMPLGLFSRTFSPANRNIPHPPAYL